MAGIVSDGNRPQSQGFSLLNMLNDDVSHSGYDFSHGSLDIEEVKAFGVRNKTVLQIDIQKISHHETRPPGDSVAAT
ncbi:hypothetical protein J2T08_004574 [Neorhizobium galegae]|nr:hypothetical protein [Neorhizobium galegae]MBP2557403.1 hypothetical protein [Neorhizobium galegae]MDQ0136638.1 hypothetical protein [Neorhizobium galegae]